MAALTFSPDPAHLGTGAKTAVDQTVAPPLVSTPGGGWSSLAVTTLNPATAVLGGPDLTMHVIGTGFRQGDVILFNGGVEPTTFVSPTELTTIVKPSTAGFTGSYPVTVKSGGLVAKPKNFSFTST